MLFGLIIDIFCVLSNSQAEVTLMPIANCQAITGRTTSSINSAIIIHYIAITSSDGNDVHLKNRRLSAYWRAHFMHNSKSTKMVGKAVNLEHDKRRNLLYEKRWNALRQRASPAWQLCAFCSKWHEHDLRIAIAKSPSQRLSNWAHADFPLHCFLADKNVSMSSSRLASVRNIQRIAKQRRRKHAS